MTVIATDGSTMSGDGRTVCGWTITSDETVKVIRLDDGRIVGTTGTVEDRILFRAYLAEGGDKPKLEDGFAALVLAPDGSQVWYGAKLVPEPVTGINAIGCGKEYALAAMLSGASPEEAVRIAAHLCIGVGGKIATLSTEHPEARP